MSKDPELTEAQTPADLITPHEDAETKPTVETEAEVNPGIEDPRHSRLGPEILDPPKHSLPRPDAK